jgi:hypothetical protein
MRNETNLILNKDNYYIIITNLSINFFFVFKIVTTELKETVLFIYFQ